MKYRIIETADGVYRAEEGHRFLFFYDWQSIWSNWEGEPVLYLTLEEAERIIEERIRLLKRKLPISERVVRYIK